MSLIPGFYRHIKSGEVFRVLGTGSSHKSPELRFEHQTVYYQQLKERKLHGTEEIIPAGYIWHDQYPNFIKRFEWNVPPHSGRE